MAKVATNGGIANKNLPFKERRNRHPGVRASRPGYSGQTFPPRIFSQTWHVILNEIAPRLLVEPYRTFDIHNDVVCDGWTRMATALREHGEGLSLPASAESLEAVVPVEVRHKLRLQMCFDSLSGLGQDESLTLEDPEQQYRIESFIERLRDCRDSVAFFALTLESLCARLILPTRDQLLFTQLMKQSLGLRLDREPIAGVL